MASLQENLIAVEAVAYQALAASNLVVLVQEERAFLALVAFQALFGEAAVVAAEALVACFAVEEELVVEVVEAFQALFEEAAAEALEAFRLVVVVEEVQAFPVAVALAARFQS